MMINNVMNELIGRKFKRNKYGLSNWTETIRNVRLFCIYEKVDGIWISKPEIMVSKSEPTYKIGFRNDWYFLNEIVLISELSEETIKILELKENLNRPLKLNDFKDL